MVDKEQLPEKVEEDIAGVQGSNPSDASSSQTTDIAEAEGTEVHAPDAGEIEWAGAVVKKAPRDDES